MTSKPCVCEGSNENCAHCFGRGYVDAAYVQPDRNTKNKSVSDVQVNEFIAKHPSFNPNPLQQPAGSGARYRPHQMRGQHQESAHEEISRPSLTSSAPVNVRLAHLREGTGRLRVLDVMKVAKEMAIPTCPRCHRQFAHQIELRAHMQSGCTNPKAPLPTIRYIPPEQVRKSRDNRLFKTLEMAKCSFCGCQVKSTNLQKHLGRCPKGPRGYSNASAKKLRPHAIEARATSTTETNNSLPEPKRLKPRDGYEQVSGRDRRDATKLYAHPCRENGKYGSHPMHDGFDDESGPE
jgi:hypothetical protein